MGNEKCHTDLFNACTASTYLDAQCKGQWKKDLFICIGTQANQAIMF